MNEFDKYVNVSIIDWIGVVDDGVSVLLNLKILEESYNVVYWISPKGERIFDFDDDFKIRFGISEPYDIPNISEFVNYVEYKVLPKKEEIWKEFGLL